MKRLLQVNQFLIGVVIAVLLAVLLPEWGARGGLLRTEITTRLGVVVIFLIQGLTLPTEELGRGLLAWRLHLFCQLFIVGVVPLVFYPAVLLLGNLPGSWGALFAGDLRIGLLYLAMLPTTVSTAIVFATQARGRVTGAIFNTALSNILAVFIVPVWSAWLIGLSAPAGEGPAVMELLWTIAQLILLPLLVGQGLRPWLKGWAKARKQSLSRVNMWIIYFMVFAAFANSIERGVWQTYGFGLLGAAFGATLSLLLIVSALAWLGSRWLLADPAERVTAFFCASQKSLASGLPMAGSIFVFDQPELGIVVLPLMLYHPLQILLQGALIPKLAGTVPVSDAEPTA
ncbi:MAG: bile acid:sodium symporter family protein [Opitutales bacterium]